jgi:hypothetical protein
MIAARIGTSDLGACYQPQQGRTKPQTWHRWWAYSGSIGYPHASHGGRLDSVEATQAGVVGVTSTNSTIRHRSLSEDPDQGFR